MVVDMGRREHHEPAFLAINPGGTVPALVHDGLVLTESTPMLERIDDAFDGPPLRPADPALRWRMRWIMRVKDNSVCPSPDGTVVKLAGFNRPSSILLAEAFASWGR